MKFRQSLLHLTLAMFGSMNIAFAACVAPPDEMVAWWPGDLNAEDIVNGNHGTEVGYEAGHVADAFSIASAGTYVQIPNSQLLEPRHVTVDAWVRASSRGPYQYIAAKGANACEAASYALYTGANGGLIFYVYDGSPGGYVLSPNTADAGMNVWNDAWHHIAGTFDGNAVRLYVNGTEVGSGTPVSSGFSIGYNLSTTNDFSIGDYLNLACGVNFSFAPGAIDEVEVFNRALSADEISTIFDAGSAGKCKTLAVAIDVKPGSEPNCMNINGHGVIPVAILGADDLDVGQIDLASLTFGGLKVRVRGKKGPLCSVEHSNDDGYLDMVCHFEDDPDYWVAGEAEAIVAGMLSDGTPIEGSDTLCLVP